MSWVLGPRMMLAGHKRRRISRRAAAPLPALQATGCTHERGEPVLAGWRRLTTLSGCSRGKPGRLDLAASQVHVLTTRAKAPRLADC